MRIRTMLFGTIYCMVLSGCAANRSQQDDDTRSDSLAAGLAIVAKEPDRPTRGELVACLPQYGCSSPSIYWWGQGMAAVTMIPANLGVCGLFSVNGTFAGTGESVYINVDANGTWILSGTSMQQGVGAWGGCVPWYYFYTSGGTGYSSVNYVGGNPYWVHNMQMNMWGTDSFCYPRGVQGKLSWNNSYYSDAYVARVEPNPWYLGAFGNQELDVTAGCFSFQNHPRVKVDPNTYYVDVGKSYAQLPPRSRAFCALESITNLQSPNAHAILVVVTNDDSQYLTNDGTGAIATASCIYYDLDAP